MSQTNGYDVIVLGAGPAGYVGAIRAAQLGARVALLDPGPPGGTCTHRGCIPTKTLLQSAKVMATVAGAGEFGIRVEGAPSVDLPAVQERKARVVRKLSDGIASLLLAHKVERISGAGRIERPGRVAVSGGSLAGQSLEAGRILIATGSEPAPLSLLVGLKPGSVLDSTGALELSALPKRMAIIGAGAVGVEFAVLFRSFGVEVTLLEALPQVLPAVDQEIARIVARRMAALGVTALAGAKVLSATDGPSGGVTLAVEQAGETRSIAVDKVLVAVGRRANTAGLDLEAAGVKLERGYVQVDERGWTGVKGLWAAGDVTGPPLLAHRASALAVTAVEAMFDQPPHHALHLIPSCIYTDPEVAAVGLTEAEVKQQGIPYRVGRFGFAANGKALAEGHDEGLVKVLVAEADGEILGVHIVGPHADTMISEMVTAMSMEATYAEVAAAIHPHPTVSETLPEALLDAFGLAIHKAGRPRPASR